MIYDKKVSLLSLTETQPGNFEWSTQKSFWANLDEPAKTNLFSKVGLGAKTAVFLLRKVDGIDLHHAFAWGGRFFFLTAVRETGPLLLEITAARVSPAECLILRRSQVIDPETKRTEYGEAEPVLRFPGILTEKYMGFQQLEPMAQTTETYVLVTPKQILLETADLVEVRGVRYALQIRHLLDEYKNEYEIIRKEDV